MTGARIGRDSAYDHREQARGATEPSDPKGGRVPKSETLSPRVLMPDREPAFTKGMPTPGSIYCTGDISMALGNL